MYTHTYIVCRTCTYVGRTYTYVCLCVHTHRHTPHLEFHSHLLNNHSYSNQFPRRKRRGLSSAVSNHHYLYKVILHFICTRDDNQVRTFPHKNFSRRKNVLNVERFSQRKVQGINGNLFIFFNIFSSWKIGKKLGMCLLTLLCYHATMRSVLNSFS